LAGNNNVMAGSAFPVFFRGVVNLGGDATGKEVGDGEVFGWPSAKVAVGEEVVQSDRITHFTS
jgi:hypothetical protein